MRVQRILLGESILVHQVAKDHTAYLAVIFNKFSVTLVRGIGHNSYIIGFPKCSGLEGGKIFR